MDPIKIKRRASNKQLKFVSTGSCRATYNFDDFVVELGIVAEGNEEYGKDEIQK